MTELTFPTDQPNLALHKVNGKTYVYDADNNAWTELDMLPFIPTLLEKIASLEQRLTTLENS